MMLHKGNLKKRGGSSSTRIPSTFIKYGDRIPHLAQHMLHSKSTYFYRWGSRGKKLSSKVTFLLPSACILALLVGGIMAVNPVMHNSTYAMTSDSGGGDTGGTESGGSETTPSIALSFPTEGLPEGFDNSENQVTTVRTNEVAYRSNIFTVTTENIDKYHIAVQAANGYNSELKGAATGEVIAGVGNNKAVGSFGNNVWGYALTEDTSASDAALTYSTVPASGNSVPQEFTPSSTVAESKNFKLTFAARIGDDKPSDHYQTKVLLSAAMNAREMVETLGFGGVKTMQEMTPSICKTLPVGEVGILEDTRVNVDGKTRDYVVVKMPDQNCWMIQNLDYDGGGTRVSTLSSWSRDQSVAQYYDPGYWAYQYDTIENINCNTKTDFSECDGKGWQLSSDDPPVISPEWTVTYNLSFVFTDTYVGTDGQTVCNKTSGSLIGDLSRGEVCMIYYYKYAYLPERQQFRVGNYYSWMAATNSTGRDVANGQRAPGSICPDNWELPDGYTQATNSYYTLLNETGVLNGRSMGDVSIISPPLYFLPGGEVNASGGGLQVAGTTGEYWSSRLASNNFSNSSYPSGDAYRLYFTSSLVATFPVSNSQYQYQSTGYGYNVRCLVSGN